MPKAIQESGAFNSTGGKYFPPEYFDSGAYKKESWHSYATGGGHPLADRARKWKSEGILIIRFEMPFNIWCNHCGELITMGIRFNAEKKRIGSFHSTSIYSFAMKCLFCSGQIVIETDPENRTYAVRSGGRMQTKEYDASDDPNTIALDSAEDVKRRQSDPMFRAEKQEEDAAKKQRLAPHLKELQKKKDLGSTSDYDAHKLLKRKFREQHGLFTDRQKEEEQARKRPRLLPEREEDRDAAKKVAFSHAPTSLADRLRKTKKKSQWDSLLF
uniref:Uncharacterized protein n=1 Tax=Eutreptiella gymnastica TaxID=73025 RepID=A0A7S4CSV3_9EUGL